MTKKEKQRLEKRKILFKKQRKERGWDDSETWSMDSTISKFVCLRLKRFKEVKCGYPGFLSSMEKWDEILDHIIYAMEVLSNDKLHYGCDLNQKEWKRVQKGCNLFGKYFQDLWW